MRFIKYVPLLACLFTTSVFATELYTTSVQKGLSDMLDSSGRFSRLKFSDGTERTTAGVGGASSFSGLSGSASASQLPVTHQGTTTATAGYTVIGDAGGSITSWFPVGMPVKVSYATTNGSGNGLGTIPYDNTIPQNTEGTQILTVSHAALSASNYLIVEGNVCLYTNNLYVGAAIFATSTASAIGAQYVTGAHNSGTGNRTAIVHPVSAPIIAGTTTSMSFALRAGSNAGDCGYNLSDSGAAILGGSSYTLLKVTEYKP